MINLDPFTAQLVELCKQLQVKELEIFGSAARDDFGPGSDIDVLVKFHGSEQLFDRYFNLREGLSAIFDRSVDVVMTEAIRNPYFKAQIDRERQIVYAA